MASYAGKRNGMHHWKCVCDCGNETIVGQTLLQSGKTYYLGSYADKKEAILARKRGEELHNDFLEWYYANHSSTATRSSTTPGILQLIKKEEEGGEK